MKILDVAPRSVVPPQRGSGARTVNLLAALSRRHEVRQLSQRGVGGVGLRRSLGETRVTPRYTELVSSSPLASLLVALGELDWPSAPVLGGGALRLDPPRSLGELLAWADVVLVEYPWQLPALRRLARDRPLVLAGHNVEAAKFASWAEADGVPAWRARPWLACIERVERRAVADADLVVAVSDDDRDELVRRYGIDGRRVCVVPNGADTEALRPVTGDERRRARRALGLPDRPTVLFAGSDVAGNRAALVWVERLARASDRFTFLVVGGVGRHARRAPSLHLTGIVDDFELVLAAADISLCPVAHGGGTKIKLLEGLAAGLPTVAFAHAIQGLAVRPGEHVLVSEEREEGLLAALGRLVDEPALAASLARAGRDFVSAHHDWRRLAERLEHALARLVDGERRALQSLVHA